MVQGSHADLKLVHRCGDGVDSSGSQEDRCLPAWSYGNIDFRAIT